VEVSEFRKEDCVKFVEVAGTATLKQRSDVAVIQDGDVFTLREPASTMLLSPLSIVDLPADYEAHLTTLRIQPAGKLVVLGIAWVITRVLAFE